MTDGAVGDGTGGISWANRNSYCLVDAPPPAATAATANAPAANAAPAYWQSDCVLPLGQCIWVLPLQVRGAVVMMGVVGVVVVAMAAFWFLRVTERRHAQSCAKRAATAI